MNRYLNKLGGVMKKFLISLLVVMPLLTGCTSNIVAKYDDFNETFTGKSYYDSLSYRATIDVISDKNQARCIGNAKVYTYPVWQFELKCSDGRAITGLLPSGKTEGKAFTNRNEKITFSVAKTQGAINNISKNYRNSVSHKSDIDSSNVPIQVIMQR
jgi:hypothetical protein